MTIDEYVARARDAGLAIDDVAMFGERTVTVSRGVERVVVRAYGAGHPWQITYTTPGGLGTTLQTLDDGLRAMGART